MFYMNISENILGISPMENLKNSIYICTDLYILKQVKKWVQQGVFSKQIYIKMQNHCNIFGGP